MTITVTLKDEAADIVERHVADGKYPDAESAVAAALLLLEEAAVDWSEVDNEAVRRMIAEADAEGGEYSLDEVSRKLDAVIDSAARR
jgi:Arc/MetJ-type ribon-helix-helix transcriptional regulator